MAKGGAKKVVYEDWTEDCEQGRYHYGKMSIDFTCDFCGGMTYYEDYVYNGQGPCKQCGEYSTVSVVEGNV